MRLLLAAFIGAAILGGAPLSAAEVTLLTTGDALKAAKVSIWWC